MSDLKTRPTGASVAPLLDSVADTARRQDCVRVLEILQRASGEEPRLWGDSIVGFGSYRYRYGSGREGDWFLTGFSPRKSALTIYINGGFDRYEALLNRLGRYRIGKSCLYVKRLSDLDEAVLEELVRASVNNMRRAYDLA